MHWRAALGMPPRLSLAERLREGAFVQGPSAARLAKLHMLGWPSVNLLSPSAGSGDWDRDDAEAAAVELRRAMAGRVRLFVLCGRRVATAFGYPHLPFFVPFLDMIAIPHPSGSSRWWRDNQAMAEGAIMELGLDDGGRKWILT